MHFNAYLYNQNNIVNHVFVIEVEIKHTLKKNMNVSNKTEFYVN